LKTSLRIILVLIEPPLPFGNAAARWFYVVLRELVERGFDVTAFATGHRQDELDQAAKLFPSPKYDLRLYPVPRRSGLKAKIETLRKPYSFMFSDEFKRDLKKELDRGFDVLHLEQLSSGWLGLEHVDKSLLHIHFLYSIDLENVNFGWKSRISKYQMCATERKLIRSYPTVTTLSERLSKQIKKISPRSTVPIVPLGIDASNYRFIPDESRTVEPIVSLIGSMNWYPSYSAAERLLTRLWPKIKERIPEARLEIVGREAKKQLAAYVGRDDILIEENVPDTLPYFQRAGVMLYAPSQGSGTKVKIQEAFCQGVPVVTTSEGVEGMPAQDGVHAGICEDDEGLIERCVELLQSASLQNLYRKAARELIESHCGVCPSVDQLELAYHRLLSAPARKRALTAL
jgi:glycosyltransferase involved in cell wall biosynthesis